MANLLSKFGKLAAVPLIVLSLATSKISARENPFQPDFDFDVRVEFAYPKHPYKPTELDEDWQENFEPLCWEPKYGDNSLDPPTHPWILGIGIGTSLRVAYKKFSIGPRIGLNYCDSPIYELSMNWWDEVVVKDIRYKEYPLNLGISSKLKLTDSAFKFEYSRHKYNVSETDYRGVDVSGGTNRSVPLKSKTLDNGYMDKFSLLFYIKNIDIGVVYMRSGNDFFGIGGRVGLSYGTK